MQPHQPPAQTKGERRREPGRRRRYEHPPLPRLEQIPFRDSVLSDAQIAELLDEHIDQLREARVIKGRHKIRADFRANVIATYHEARKAAFRTDSGQTYTGWPRLAQALYRDVETREEAYRKLHSMQRWMRALQIIGALDYEAVKDHTGADRGLRWELRSGHAAGVAQLARATRRRRRSHRERSEERVRRHCYGAGRSRRAPVVFEPGGAGSLFLGSRKWVAPRSEQSFGPTGLTPAHNNSSRRARGAPNGRAQANLLAEARPALKRWWSKDGSEEKVPELFAATPALKALAPLRLARLALEVLAPGISPAISAKRQHQLEAAVRRFDRFGYPGLGRERLLEVILAGNVDGRVSVRFLGGVAARLRNRANLWRRNQSDERLARSEAWRRRDESAGPMTRRGSDYEERTRERLAAIARLRGEAT